MLCTFHRVRQICGQLVSQNNFKTFETALKQTKQILSTKTSPNHLKIKDYRKPLLSQAAFFPSSVAFFHTTTGNLDLMEFFDDKTNWGEDHVKVGRSWKKDELRIKSNTDLHKLWYVLLKEKNMLLTMEYACKMESEVFANPERLDKIEDSMQNLEEVVRERNRAYFQLETGEIGERRRYRTKTALGMPINYTVREHDLPFAVNMPYRRKYLEKGAGPAVGRFHRQLKEKINSEKFQQHRRDFFHVKALLKRFPDMDDKALEAKYPKLNIPKIKEYIA